jgi:hypothetical protein
MDLGGRPVVLGEGGALHEATVARFQSHYYVYLYLSFVGKDSKCTIHLQENEVLEKLVKTLVGIWVWIVAIIKKIKMLNA